MGVLSERGVWGKRVPDWSRIYLDLGTDSNFVYRVLSVPAFASVASLSWVDEYRSMQCRLPRLVLVQGLIGSSPRLCALCFGFAIIRSVFAGFSWTSKLFIVWRAWVLEAWLAYIIKKSL